MLDKLKCLLIQLSKRKKMTVPLFKKQNTGEPRLEILLVILLSTNGYFNF